MNLRFSDIQSLKKHLPTPQHLGQEFKYVVETYASTEEAASPVGQLESSETLVLKVVWNQEVLSWEIPGPIFLD